MNRGTNRGAKLTTPGTDLAKSLIKHVKKKITDEDGVVKETTNLSLDGAFGGTFHYTQNELPELYQTLANAFCRSQKYYLNEINGKKRTFVVEMDISSLRRKFEGEHQNESNTLFVPRRRTQKSREDQSEKEWEVEFSKDIEAFVKEVVKILSLYYENKYPDLRSCIYQTVVQTRLPDFTGTKPEMIEALKKRCGTLKIDDRVPCSEGAHVIFKNLIVDTEQSLQLHAHIVEHLAYIEKIRPGTIMPYSASNWEHVVDPLVYDEKRGIRYFGSSKAKECTSCKGVAAGGQCLMCTGIGKIDVGRVYDRISFVMNGDGSKDEVMAEKYRTDVQTMFIDTSLRRDNSQLTEGYAVHPTAPKPTMIKNFVSKTNIEKLKGRPFFKLDGKTGGLYSPDQYAPTGKSEGINKRKRGETPIKVNLTREQEVVALTVIRGLSPLFYGQIDIYEVFRKENPPMMIIKTRGPGCQYCHNIAYRIDKTIKYGGRHNNHTIFFEIEPSIVRQGCTDECEPGKRSDPSSVKLRKTNQKCSRYRNDPILTSALAADAARVLFPGLGSPNSAMVSGSHQIHHLDYSKLASTSAVLAYNSHTMSMLASSIQKRRKALKMNQ